VTVQVPDGFDGERFAVNFHFVRLHNLLDGGSDMAQLHVNSSLLVFNILFKYLFT
jgi:hypothetical protein